MKERGVFWKVRRAAAVAIPPEVKRRVSQRDSFDGLPCCILCGSPKGQPDAHVIPRSDNGLGIEENIVTLCWDCHQKYDNSADRMKLREEIIFYLKSIQTMAQIDCKLH